METSVKRQPGRLRPTGKKTQRQQETQIVKVVRREEKRARELKFFDTSQSAVNLAAGASINVLSGIPQGAAQSQRVGDSVLIDHCQYTYAIVQLNADIYSDSRVIIFQWHPNSTLTSTPVLADILPNTAAVGLYSAYNWQYRNQYTILHDELWSMSGLTTAPTSTSAISKLNIRIHPRKKKIVFAPGAITGSGLLWLLTISDSAAAPFPLFSIQFRTVYTDE